MPGASTIQQRGAGVTQNRNPNAMWDNWAGALMGNAGDGINDLEQQRAAQNQPNVQNDGTLPTQVYDRPSYNQYQPNAYAQLQNYMNQQKNNFSSGINSAMQQMMGINQGNQTAELLIKMLNAQVDSAAIPARYNAQAQAYKSDNDLRSSLAQTDAYRYNSDNVLAGNKYGSDATVNATGLTANSALEAARAQAAAQQAAAQAQANATLQAAQAQANALLEQTRLQQSTAERMNQAKLAAMQSTLGGFTGVLDKFAGGLGGLGGVLGGVLGGGTQQPGQPGGGSAFAAPQFDDPMTKVIAQLRGI